MESSKTLVITEKKMKEEPEVKEEKQENIVFRKLTPKPVKKVKWTEDTIDNEFLNKKKSKSILKYF